MKRFFAFLLALGLLGTGAYALGPEPETLYPGMDVSSYQGPIDFSAAAADGIQVVYIRAGAGADYTDPYFARNVRQARAAGLRFGCYHYVTAATPAEARQQAAFFATLLEGLGSDCRPAMDYESYSGLSAAESNAVALAFLTELEARTGQTPLLYTDAWAAEALWKAPLGDYPLWCANWGAAEPEVNGGPWDAWAGFQYTDRGAVAGVSGDVDRDSFTAAVFLTAPVPTPPPTRTHTVVCGDTLWAIACRYGSTVWDIVRENGIPDPDLIYPGQVFVIP